MFDPFGFRLDLWRPLVLVPQPFWHGFGLDGGLVWDPETMWNLILFNTLMGVKYVDPHLGGLPTSSLQKKPGVAARGGTYFASLRMMRKGICFRSGLGITLICLVVHSPQSFFVGILYIYIYIYIFTYLIAYYRSPHLVGPYALILGSANTSTTSHVCIEFFLPKIALDMGSSRQNCDATTAIWTAVVRVRKNGATLLRLPGEMRCH